MGCNLKYRWSRSRVCKSKTDVSSKSIKHLLNVLFFTKHSFNVLDYDKIRYKLYSNVKSGVRVLFVGHLATQRTISFLLYKINGLN